MKKICTLLSLFFLTGCLKSNPESSGNQPGVKTSYEGTLIIGPVVRHLSDSSEANPAGSGYILNGNVQSITPAFFATNNSSASPNSTFYVAEMTDSRNDTLSYIQFNMPYFSTFSNYSSPVFITIGDSSITAVADISFTVVNNDGSFDMVGDVVVSPGDTTNFSFNGTFKNMPH